MVVDQEEKMQCMFEFKRTYTVDHAECDLVQGPQASSGTTRSYVFTQMHYFTPLCCVTILWRETRSSGTTLSRSMPIRQLYQFDCMLRPAETPGEQYCAHDSFLERMLTKMPAFLHTCISAWQSYSTCEISSPLLGTLPVVMTV